MCVVALRTLAGGPLVGAQTLLALAVFLGSAPLIAREIGWIL